MLVPKNYRMNDLTAERGLGILKRADELKTSRHEAAGHYAVAVGGCPWIKSQLIPEGHVSDYWCYAVVLESAELWEPFTEAIVRHGGEMPYGAWRLTYQEPAFEDTVIDVVEDWTGSPGDSERLPIGICPVAEDLQPRLCQMQTNNVQSAQRNADAVAKAIREMDG